MNKMVKETATFRGAWDEWLRTYALMGDKRNKKRKEQKKKCF